MDVNIVNLK